MAAGKSECTSQETMTDSSSSFFQFSLNTQESSTRVGVLGWKMKPTKVENTTEYFCDVCKISLNSQIQAAAHYQGKSHQNKVKTAEKIAEIEVLKEISHSSNPATGKPQETKPGTSTRFEIAPSEDNSTSNVAINPPPTVSANVSAISTPHVTQKRNPNHPMMCEVCQKSFNSELQAEQHFTSKAHINKIKSLTSTCSVSNTSAVPSLPTYETKPAEVKLGKNISTELCHCKECNITLNSLRQLQQHKRGLRHKIMTGKATAPPPAFEGWEGVRYKKLSAVIPDSNGFVAKTSNISTTGTRLGQFYCETCDISVNSQSQLNQHMFSQKHKLVASGQIKKKREENPSPHSTMTQPVQFSCDNYNLHMNSQSQLDQHMLSPNRSLVASGRKNTMQQHNSPSPSSTGTSFNQYRCETCSVSVNSQSQLDQHLSSPKHAMVASGQPPSGTGGQGRGQVQGRGRGQTAYRGGRSRGRGRSSGGIIPLSMSFVKKELYKGGAAHGNTMPSGSQVHRGARGVWRGQPRRGQRVSPY